jgi:hypothetical protein
MQVSVSSVSSVVHGLQEQVNHRGRRRTRRNPHRQFAPFAYKAVTGRQEILDRAQGAIRHIRVIRADLISHDDLTVGSRSSSSKPYGLLSPVVGYHLRRAR